MRVLRKRFLLEDYHLIQDQILRTKFKKNVQQIVKRIYIKISGVKGLSGLREIFRNMEAILSGENCVQLTLLQSNNQILKDDQLIQCTRFKNQNVLNYCTECK